MLASLTHAVLTLTHQSSKLFMRGKLSPRAKHYVRPAHVKAGYNGHESNRRRPRTRWMYTVDRDMQVVGLE